nr:MAG TPA: hypothetical protein [Caudoviricetes sp.]
MNVSIEEKKTEAISRMKMLGLYPTIIREFGRDFTVNRSDPPFGALYWVEDKELEELRAWEIEHNALVYHVVRSYTTFGTLDAYLYVSDVKEEWDVVHDDLEDGNSLVYVVNHDMPDCSEFGYIGIKTTSAAGLVRTY